MDEAAIAFKDDARVSVEFYKTGLIRSLFYLRGLPFPDGFLFIGLVFNCETAKG